MLHFFAKFGRRPVAKYILPAISTIATVGYYGAHSCFHNQIRDLLAAQTTSGHREEISQDLKELIKNVYIQLHDSYNKSPLDDLKLFQSSKSQPLIKWFASSTLEPITLGMADSWTGILIGLPNFYNYQRPEEIPNELFEIRQLNLFRSPQALESDQLGDELRESLDTQEVQTIRIKHLDKNSDEGQEYIDSLLLSEDAKKFSIARELCLGDTYRPVFNSCVIFLSSSFGINLSRLGVYRLKLAERHIGVRLPFYALGSFAAYGIYYFLSTSSNEYYAKEADKRAMELGDEYKRGASEYYKKRTKRRILLGL